MNSNEKPNVFAIETKVLKKIRKTCVNQRDLMDFALDNHYNDTARVSEYCKTLVCEMHAINSKIIESIDSFMQTAPEFEREGDKKKELLLQDSQLIVLESSLLARSELSSMMLRNTNISTHCH
jgi:hypothetical protein|tara:strand:+ start:25 stop:393 length:369 start_codon:yes stop_codon:yes gene_type:complete